MANIFLKRDGMQHGGSPYGNQSTFAFNIKTNASGVVLNGSSTTAPKANDVIVLGVLPNGFRLEDAQIFVTTPMTAGITGDLGFVYEDGVNSNEVPQDPAYFGAGLVLNAAGRLRATGTKLVTLPKNALLVLTIKGAANAKEADVSVVVQGELTGER